LGKDGKWVCLKKSIYKPRAVCSEFAMNQGQKHCVKRTVFYGKNKYDVKCEKSGSLIKRKEFLNGKTVNF